MAATPLEEYRFNGLEPTPLSERIGRPEFRLRPDFDLTSLPAAKDLSKYDTPVQDQQVLNSCTAFVSTGIVEHIAKRNGKDAKCSELYAYYTSRVQMQHKEPGDDSGVQSIYCIKALEKYGDAHEADWPYEQTKLAEEPPLEAYNRGSVNQVVHAGYLYPILDNIRAAVASERPVFIGFIAFAGMVGPHTTETGVISVPPRDGPDSHPLGSHAMMVVGYDDDSRLFKCKNSWGAQRGQAGYYFLPYDYLDAVLDIGGGKDLPLMHDDCWTIDAVEYESDDVVLHDRPRPIRNLMPFELSARVA